MNMQKVFKQRYVDTLRVNIDPKNYKKRLFEYDESQIITSNTIVAPVDLLKKVDPKDDYKTAIALYEAYPNLDRIDVADQRLWTYLAHVDLYPYMRKRWSKVFTGDIDENSENYILYHWFMKTTAQNNQLRHALAGLWWGVKMSVDETKSDKYELTEILLGRQLDPLRRHLGTSKLFRYSEARLGILEFIKEREDLFEHKFQDKFRFVSKHLTSVGGVKCISYFDRDFFKSELVKVIPKINAI